MARFQSGDRARETQVELGGLSSDSAITSITAGRGLGIIGAVGDVTLYSLAAGVEVPFAYDSGVKLFVANVIVNERVLGFRIIIDTAFNDGSATLSVGHTGSTEGLVAQGEIELQSIGVFNIVGNHLYGGDDTIWLYLDPKGSTQGAGSLFYFSQRN